MDYVWIAIVSVAVGLYGNRYIASSGYRLSGDIMYALAGGLFAAFLFRMTTISIEVGLAGVLVFAGIGAGLFLVVRRSFNQA